jgi:glycosyltransferase involved in cell wall biosynthesis
VKLIIQMPCLNEERSAADLARRAPSPGPRLRRVEWLIIDDGSTDRTIEVAKELGVDHIVKLTNNKGLAYAFQAGLDACLKLGADVIVQHGRRQPVLGGLTSRPWSRRWSGATPTWSSATGT